MAKIAYVKAWGLWSHLETVFEFSPGLTVITGPNGSGKSTLIRIIKWVAQGEPSGETFIFKVTDETTGEVIKQSDEGKAEIGLDNGIVITKTRRKGKTVYTINTVAEPFEKAEVPQEVKDALGLKKHSFGDFETYLNYAFQLEAPFLLSESPSIGAKVLGKLAGTEAVDLAIREVAKRTHKAREEKRLADKEIERINGDLLDYQDLDDIKQQVTACEYLVQQIDAALSTKDKLQGYKYAVQGIDETVAKLDIELVNYENLVVAAESLGMFDTLVNRVVDLKSLCTQLSTKLAELQSLEQDLILYKDVNLASELVTNTAVKASKLEELLNLAQLFKSSLLAITKADEYLDTVKDIDVAAADLKHLDKIVADIDTKKELRGQYISSDSEILRLVRELEALKDIELGKELLDSLEVNIKRIDDLKELQNTYKIKDATAKLAAMDLEDAISCETTAVEELDAAWTDAGEICPICEQPVNKHSQVARVRHA